PSRITLGRTFASVSDLWRFTPIMATADLRSITDDCTTPSRLNHNDWVVGIADETTTKETTSHQASHKHNCHSERSEEPLTISGFLNTALEKESEIRSFHSG